MTDVHESDETLVVASRSDMPAHHAGVIAPVAPRSGRLRPLGLDAVRLDGGFWGTRQERNAGATLAHIEHWLEETGWLGNFDAAVEGRLPGDRTGREFSDSEVYKLLEAMAWQLGRRDDVSLRTRFDRIVARVASAQEADGYLNTNFGRPGQGDRWSDLEWGHELYCNGHLIQAAVARARTGAPDDTLVTVARRAADLICEVFAPGGIESVGGHPEIEPALVELYRVTGEGRYLEQARLFLERRGHHTLDDIEFGRGYFQDDVPIREATVLRGHAVRATYLSAGAIDLAVETRDEALADIVSRQWRATVARRTYITGGMGSHHQDEAFGEDFVLPPDRAYSETCAGIGSIMVSWRLLLHHGDVAHADLIERTLYNVVATSPSPEGTGFFYTNTLHRREPGLPAEADRPSPRAASSQRAPWFDVSCCPTNVARTLASLAAYVATVDDDGVQLHQYAAGEVRTTLEDGRRVWISIDTAYPDDGVIGVTTRGDEPLPWTLTLRVPQWAQGATIERDGEVSPASPGTVSIRRTWADGDTVMLRLPMVPHFTWADPRIDAIRGCVAVERGPEVLCLESVDIPGGFAMDALTVDPMTEPAEREGRVVVTAAPVAHGAPDWPYSPTPPSPDIGSTLTEVPLVPYHDWAQRGPSTMRVWLPTADVPRDHPPAPRHDQTTPPVPRSSE